MKVYRKRAYWLTLVALMRTHHGRRDLGSINNCPKSNRVDTERRPYTRPRVDTQNTESQPTSGSRRVGLRVHMGCAGHVIL
ncbi:hypothetical protein EJ02DRAFT_255508 [Clathrospora elynae]|uniref:Uncharacterized protein n=1 Tax=Clathrospora elynae TaxID=706981 RepID=A0A6A5SI80_9PLEO|nr:hypothetical protein EJ02DRAFT_255508 [Clathrospora elynae]